MGDDDMETCWWRRFGTVVWMRMSYAINAEYSAFKKCENRYCARESVSPESMILNTSSLSEWES